jgi:hypothetical protein
MKNYSAGEMAKMVWTIGTVTLPFTPERMSVQVTANKQTEPQSGDFPLAMVDGFNGTVTLSGKFEGDFDDNYTAYISALEALVGTQVSCVLGSKSGTFLLEDVKYDPENPSVTPYSLKLTQVSAVFALS